MNVISKSPISIPVSNGLFLTVHPGFEKALELAMPHLPSITDAIHRYHNSPLLSEFLDTVLARFLRENDYKAKSAHMLKARLSKLKHVLTAESPARRVCELGTHDIQRVKDELPKLLNQNRTSGSKGENLQAYYSLFNRIIDQAIGDRLVDEPGKIVSSRRKKSEVTKAFLDSNLVSLFQAWPFRFYQTGTPKNAVLQDARSYCFWLPPLALFTGARLNELCQLRVHDIIEDSHGVRLISINANGFDKSLKNQQSAREIPICSKLVDLGFLEFVEERRLAGGADALLFSELVFDAKHLYSRSPSRFFCGPVTGTGLIGESCPVALEGGLNFKSFRRSFAVRLERSGIPAETIAHLLGHRPSSQEVTSEHYLEKPQSIGLLEQMDLGLSYNISLENVHWLHFKNLMTSQLLRQKRGRRKTAK